MKTEITVAITNRCSQRNGLPKDPRLNFKPALDERRHVPSRERFGYGFTIHCLPLYKDIWSSTDAVVGNLLALPDTRISLRYVLANATCL